MAKNNWLRCLKCKCLFHKQSKEKCSGAARYRVPFVCLLCEPEIVTVGPVPGEMLLAEPSDVPVLAPQVVAPAPAIPGAKAFTDDLEHFETRMTDLKFARSDTQEDTPPDGDCALHASLGRHIYLCFCTVLNTISSLQIS